MIVVREDGRYVIDDVFYGVGESPQDQHGRLSGEFEGCRGPRWIGGP